jgi:DNA-binding NarL/FixJ family response regulator
MCACLTENRMKRPSVLLADDHAIVADGLRSLLKNQFDLLGSVGDGIALVDAAQRLRPDVIVSDIAMPLMTGLEALREVVALGLPSRMILLTMLPDGHLATEAFRLGAWGYLLKSAAGEELITAINEVMEGRAYLTPGMTAPFVASMTPRAQSERTRLTRRQSEVVRLIAEGKGMKEIAAMLSLSRRTVESHKYEAMQLLGLRNTAELIQYALRHVDAENWRGAALLAESRSRRRSSQPHAGHESSSPDAQ